MIEAELLDLMTETVLVEPLASLNGSGAGQYTPGSGRNWKARIEQRNRLTRDRDGREVVSQTQLTMAPTSVDGSLTSIAVGDRITLAAGYSPQQPPIIAVSRLADVDGSVHHFEVEL